MASLIEDNAVQWKIRQGGLPEYQRVSTLGILKNNITAPTIKILNPIIPVGAGPSKLLFVDDDIQTPTSPIISEAP